LKYWAFLPILAFAACTSTTVKPVQTQAVINDSAANDSTDAERLLADVPAGWVQIGATTTSTFRIAEFTPEADLKADPSVAQGNWREKITLERLAGEPVPDPLVFLDGLKSDHLEGCAKGSYLPISSTEENRYPTAVAMLVCPRLALADAGQVTMIKVIQGNSAFYTITRSIRTRPFSASAEDKPPPPPVDKEVIGGFSVWLKAISVCAPDQPDHPCKAEATDHE
jgi:hypothetical protein